MKTKAFKKLSALLDELSKDISTDLDADLRHIPEAVMVSALGSWLTNRIEKGLKLNKKDPHNTTEMAFTRKEVLERVGVVLDVVVSTLIGDLEY